MHRVRRATNAVMQRDLSNEGELSTWGTGRTFRAPILGEVQRDFGSPASNRRLAWRWTGSARQVPLPAGQETRAGRRARHRRLADGHGYWPPPHDTFNTIFGHIRRSAPAGVCGDGAARRARCFLEPEVGVHGDRERPQLLGVHLVGRVLDGGLICVGD